MKTYTARKQDIERKWYLIDAEGKVLGRLASRVASILRGKHKPIYTPHLDTGDYVIVINASKVRLTGEKPEQKFYYRYSGYPGGLKSVRYDKLLKEKPTRIIKAAVKGMLPHNKLGRAMLKKLKVCAGPEHQYQAQRPEAIDF
jgi:large subunit ribosomal protein L13